MNLHWVLTLALTATPVVDAGTPPPFPQTFAARGELLRFEANGSEVRLEPKLADAERARTFVVCAGTVRPLGKYLRPATMKAEVGGSLDGGVTGYEDEAFLYQSPCAAPVFITRGADVRSGDFKVAKKVPAFVPARLKNSRLISGCSLVRNGVELRLAPAALSDCKLELAGDLNGDGVVDAFVLHDADICRAATLWLSNPTGWSVFATEVLWCPD